MHQQKSENAPALTMVDSNGQIFLGKEFAGKQVQVEIREPGVWVIRTVVIVPANELWLHSPEASASLSRAVAWAAVNPAVESDLTEIVGEVGNGSATKK